MSRSVEFFKFPHTPHLLWLGRVPPRADKVLSPSEVERFLSQEVVVEEKIDGANLGFSVGVDGSLKAQNRGTYLTPPGERQFSGLWNWLRARNEGLVENLGANLMLFGEWCLARHAIRYDLLPDWFLGFDVYDRVEGRFWGTRRRDQLLEKLGLRSVPKLAQGVFLAHSLPSLIGHSGFAEGPMEGIYLRRESGDWLIERAKVVSAQFVQSIEEHWRNKPFERNRLHFVTEGS